MNIKIILAMLFSRPHKRYNCAIKTEKMHVGHLFEYNRQILYTQALNKHLLFLAHETISELSEWDRCKNDLNIIMQQLTGKDL